MQAHEFLSPYQAKAVEYLIAVTYLVLFVPFWRFVNGSVPAVRRVRAAVPQRRSTAWFEVPDGISLHPGHAWLKTNGGGAVAVGMDDFAQKLIGPIDALDLPRLGATLRQGEPAWRLHAAGKAVDMLAPVEGEVVEVNHDAAVRPGRIAQDPYGQGWLVKLRPSRLDGDLKQLLAGEAARRYMESVTDALRARMSPEVGLLLQDGGQPVHGIAPELDPERWDEIARGFFLS
jgi:glycine cleavage system H lipoate-binding protein